jgi:hypothetical protein
MYISPSKCTNMIPGRPGPSSACNTQAPLHRRAARLVPEKYERWTGVSKGKPRLLRASQIHETVIKASCFYSLLTFVYSSWSSRGRLCCGCYTITTNAAAAAAPFCSRHRGYTAPWRGLGWRIGLTTPRPPLRPSQRLGRSRGKRRGCTARSRGPCDRRKERGARSAKAAAADKSGGVGKGVGVHS